MVSHETSLLPAGCKRAVLLHEGNILADGDIEKVLDPEVLEKAYRCRMDVLKLAGRRYTVNKS
jgi:ABC-type cobalamin/Fe3+-siderophores transport system ATPase subunit